VFGISGDQLQSWDVNGVVNERAGGVVAKVLRTGVTVGEIRLTSDGRSLVVCDDEGVQFLDPSTGTVQRTIAYEAGTRGLNVGLNPDSTLIASIVADESGGTAIVVQKAADETEAYYLSLKDIGDTLAVNPDGKSLAVGRTSAAGRTAIWVFNE
jgi:Tol biopolymer transport system component